MNNNNHIARAYAYAYRTHETEVFHGGRLGCWVDGRGAVAARWALRAVEGLALAVLAVVFCALCAVA